MIAKSPSTRAGQSYVLRKHLAVQCYTLNNMTADETAAPYGLSFGTREVRSAACTIAVVVRWEQGRYGWQSGRA